MLRMSGRCTVRFQFPVHEQGSWWADLEFFDLVHHAACSIPVGVKAVRPHYVRFPELGASRLLDMGFCYVSANAKSKASAKVVPLVIENARRVDCRLEWTTTLPSQVFLYFDKQLTLPVPTDNLAELPSTSSSITVYVALRPRLTAAVLARGESRVLSAGITFRTYVRSSASSAISADDGTPDLPAAELVESSAVRVKAVVGSSVLQILIPQEYAIPAEPKGHTSNTHDRLVSVDYMDFGWCSKPAPIHSLFVLRNASTRLPLRYRLKASMDSADKYSIRIEANCASGTVASSSQNRHGVVAEQARVPATVAEATAMRGQRVIHFTFHPKTFGLHQAHIRIVNREDPDRSMRLRLRCFVDPGWLVVSLAPRLKSLSEDSKGQASSRVRTRRAPFISVGNVLVVFEKVATFSKGSSSKRVAHPGLFLLFSCLPSPSVLTL